MYMYMLLFVPVHDFYHLWNMTFMSSRSRSLR